MWAVVAEKAVEGGPSLYRDNCFYLLNWELKPVSMVTGELMLSTQNFNNVKIVYFIAE